jgi:hypothetical protein
MLHAPKDCGLPTAAEKFNCGKLATPYFQGNGINFYQCIKTGFVTITLALGDENKNLPQKTITVGNKSSPFHNNDLYIVDFNFGVSTGPSCEFTIYDASGYDVSAFLQSLFRDSCTAVKSTVLVDFGWILVDQDNNVGVQVTAGKQREYKWRAAQYTSQAVPFYGKNYKYASVNDITGEIYQDYGKATLGNRLGFTVSNLEVNANSNGTWSYKVKCVTLLDNRAQKRLQSRSYGTSNNPVALKQAVGQLVADACRTGQASAPQDTAAIFITSVTDGNGKAQDIKFSNSEGGEMGPAAVWSPNRQSATASARNWTLPLTTDRGLGMTMYTDPVIDSPNLVFLEADPTICTNPRSAYCGSRPSPKLIYVVNGGDCSPVIEFNPKVSYTIAGRAQGGTSGSGSVAKQPSFRARDICPQYGGTDKIEVSNASEGIQTNGVIQNNSSMWRFPTIAPEKINEAISANLIANSTVLQNSLITGELKIFGDPQYVNIAKCQGETIGIIYVNNPAVSNGLPAGQEGPRNQNFDWLAYPQINSTFSRLDYRIMGVSHTIDSSGFYTTTIQVQATPNQASGRRPRAQS